MAESSMAGIWKGFAITHMASCGFWKSLPPPVRWRLACASSTMAWSVSAMARAGQLSLYFIYWLMSCWIFGGQLVHFMTFVKKHLAWHSISQLMFFTWYIDMTVDVTFNRTSVNVTFDMTFEGHWLQYLMVRGASNISQIYIYKYESWI